MSPPPDPGSPPGGGTRPKQSSQSELDRTLYGASKQARRDDPRRKLSSPSMAAMTAPAPATGETAPTVPAPRQDAATLRAAPGMGHEEVRIVEPATGQPGPTLPPPSASSQEASVAAQRREIERVTAERDQARAQVQLERLRVEELAAAHEQARLDAAAKLASLQLEVERERTKQAHAPAKPWLDERLVKALVALLTALAGLGAPLGVWLTVKTTSYEKKQERQAEKAEAATATATSAKVESRSVDKELDELKKQFVAERVYDREVLRRAGIEIPKRPGDPDPPKLETESPRTRTGRAPPMPLLIVKTEPP